MKNSKIKNVVVHIVKDESVNSLADKINEFYADVISRRLNQSELSKEDKIAVVDKMIENVKMLL